MEYAFSLELLEFEALVLVTLGDLSDDALKALETGEALAECRDKLSDAGLEYVFARCAYVFTHPD